MADSLMRSKLRRVKYITPAGGNAEGYFHRYVVRQGDYKGYSKAALIETDLGKMVISPFGEFYYISPQQKKYRRVVFTNANNATEVGYFHMWTTRKGVYVGVNTFAVVETKEMKLILFPYNKLTFVDID